MTPGFFSLRYPPTPVIVPPVPTPATKISTSPPVSSHISGPVVFLCASGLERFSNCPGIKLPSVSPASSSAFSIAPFIPLLPSVRTISAPYALIIFLRSTLIVSGSTIINLYPFAAAIAARPMPVFPDVGSIITEPGFNIPFFSASSIISLAILSFTLPEGLKYSSFARSLASKLYFFSICASLTNGVFPISSVAPLYILDICDLLKCFIKIFYNIIYIFSSY